MNLEKISKLTNELIQDKYKLTILRGELKELNSGDYKPSSEEVVFTSDISRGREVSLYALENAIADFKHLLENSEGYDNRLLFNPDYIECADTEDVTITFETVIEPVAWEDWDEEVIYINISAYVKKHGEGLEQVKAKLERV